MVAIRGRLRLMNGIGYLKLVNNVDFLLLTGGAQMVITYSRNMNITLNQ